MVEAGRLPQQLRHLAPVVLAEVLPHPAAQVDRLADVQHPATGVTELVDAGGAGERGHPAQLLTLRVTCGLGQLEQVVEVGGAEAAHPL